MLAAAALLLALAAGPPADGPPPGLLAAGTGLSVQVTGRESGPVELWSADRLVAVVPAGDGPATVRSNLPGEHTLVARRDGLESAPVLVGATPGVARPTAPTGAGVAISVVIPAGSLTLTTVRDADPSRSVVTVTDTRAGELGFVVAVSAGRRGDVVRTWAEQVPGNAMLATDVSLAAPGRLQPGRSVAVACYPAGLSLGSVRVGVQLDRPARVTWTVM